MCLWNIYNAPILNDQNLNPYSRIQIHWKQLEAMEIHVYFPYLKCIRIANIDVVL